MSEQVSTEAAIWLSRIERGLQPHEGAQLSQWLQQPEHRDSVVSSAKLYHGPDVVAVLAELVPVGFGNPPPPMPRQPRTFAIAVAIGLALFMILPLVIGLKRGFHQSGPGALPRDERIFDTDAGETRSVKLPEGSEVMLNGQSQLYVLNAAWVREATLGHGEAQFDVTRKWPRPLDVFAGGRHFIAAGGRFDLRVSGANTVVLIVMAGTVTVQGLPFRRPTTPAEARDFDPSVFADANIGPMQTALFDNGVMSRHAISAADVRSQLRWEPEQVVYVSP